MRPRADRTESDAERLGEPDVEELNYGLIVQKRNVSGANAGYNYGLWSDLNGKLFFQFYDGSSRGFTSAAVCH